MLLLSLIQTLQPQHELPLFFTIFYFRSLNHAHCFFQVSLTHIFIVSTISFPCPGTHIILSIVILKLDESKERKYNDIPQRYCLQKPTVLSQIVQFLFNLLPISNSFNIKSYVRELFMNLVDYHLKDKNGIKIVFCDFHLRILYYNFQLTMTYHFQSDQTEFPD